MILFFIYCLMMKNKFYNNIFFFRLASLEKYEMEYKKEKVKTLSKG